MHSSWNYIRGVLSLIVLKLNLKFQLEYFDSPPSLSNQICNQLGYSNLHSIVEPISINENNYSIHPSIQLKIDANDEAFFM